MLKSNAQATGSAAFDAATTKSLCVGDACGLEAPSYAPTAGLYEPSAAPT